MVQFLQLKYIARAKKGNQDILMIMLNAHNRWPNAKRALDAVIN